MSLNLAEKQAVVAEVAKVAASAHLRDRRRVPWTGWLQLDPACESAGNRRLSARCQEHPGAACRAGTSSSACS